MQHTTQRTHNRRWRTWRQRCVVAACLAACVDALAAEPTQVAYITARHDARYTNTNAQDRDLVVSAIETSPDVRIYRTTPGAEQRDVARTEGVKVAANTATGPIAVLYPDIGEPYRSVFSTIIEGIEEKTRAPVTNIAVGADADAQRITDDLHRQNVKVVIALGRHGLKIASGLDRNIGVVGGGVISAADDERALSVLSLAPDPQLLFERLKRFAPATRRVFVVYNPRHNNWLIRLAREAAQFHQIELVTHEAEDLKTALLHYRQILAQAKSPRDALWLPQDSTTVEEATVIPLILEETWNRSLVVFSSNVAHVRRGVLFALYPNNIELGRRLASSALDYLAGGDQAARGLVPLKSVLMAVNVRTASHLGIQLSYQQQRRFDLIFPER